MTELQAQYTKIRVENPGLSHGAAVRRVARSTGLDADSVFRALARAKREDERDARRKKAVA